MHSALLEKAFHLDLSLLEAELCLTDFLLCMANDRCSSRVMHCWQRGAREPSLPMAEGTPVCEEAKAVAQQWKGLRAGPSACSQVRGSRSLTLFVL